MGLGSRQNLSLTQSLHLHKHAVERRLKLFKFGPLERGEDFASQLRDANPNINCYLSRLQTQILAIFCVIRYLLIFFFASSIVFCPIGRHTLID